MSIVKDQFNPRCRKKLKLKMAVAFNENIQVLPVDLQEMLLDDRVTAFENRLEGLNKAQSNARIDILEDTDYKTIKA